MTRFFSFAATIIFSLSFLGGVAQKISKTDCEFYYNEMNKFKDSIKVLDKNINGKDAEISAKEKEINNLTKRLDRLNSKGTLLSELDYRNIGKFRLTANNLSEEQIKLLIPSIELAQSREDWLKASKSDKPAFCYHREDITKRYGVLLNIPALVELQKVLQDEKSVRWRLPEPKDFNYILEYMKKVRGNTPYYLLASSSTEEPKWASPGIDLFDLNIVPLSYRRISVTEWSGKNQAGFYCLNEGDPKIKKNIYIAYINNYDPNNPIEVESKGIVFGEDESCFGLYVRLIGKE